VNINIIAMWTGEGVKKSSYIGVHSNCGV